ncbi:MAG: hypothetical protein CMF49_01940 [Legionellales bacterium]|nr:hypothetical protein [Legionellales bacterium]|tara:strand:- start:6 stop:494 length:489 start_codon:yes stop_codon:yes gene_type:complete
MSNDIKSPSPNIRRAIKWFGSLVIIILVANFCYQIWARYVHPENSSAKTAHCSIQDATCQVHMKDGQSVSLTVNPKPITAGQTIKAVIKIQGLKPNKAYIVTFPIGQAPPQPKPTPLRLTSTGDYTADLQMPANPQHDKKWAMMILIQTDKTNYAIPYRFEM